MSTVVDLRKTDDPRDAIHRAVHLLAEGHIVAFPTETAYAPCVNALLTTAVQKLVTSAGKSASSHPTLILKGFHEAIDYVPNMDNLAQRLARRCWPGPVTLAFRIGSEPGLFGALPPETRAALAPDNRLWIRVPAHDCIHGAMRLMPAPLVAGGERGQDGRALTTSDYVLAAWDGNVELVIDDGECRYAEPATVVEVESGAWSIVEPGVVKETMIGRLACELFLFICTGNTCRSPLAEGFFRKMLADRLHCAEDELADHGYMVMSAGMSAEPGLPASLESIEAARRAGVDLRGHESQPVTDRLLEQADRIFTMTQSHRDALLASYPRLAPRVELLARDKTDISDPIGGPQEEYEVALKAIEKNLRAILESLPL
jgi:tRNA threonylcarbamoyl adenosine modification protein (Sua5/YciO/YrdC/YwlC family)